LSAAGDPQVGDQLLPVGLALGVEQGRSPRKDDPQPCIKRRIRPTRPSDGFAKSRLVGEIRGECRPIWCGDALDLENVAEGEMGGGRDQLKGLARSEADVDKCGELVLELGKALGQSSRSADDACSIAVRKQRVAVTDSATHQPVTPVLTFIRWAHPALKNDSIRNLVQEFGA